MNARFPSGTGNEEISPGQFFCDETGDAFHRFQGPGAKDAPITPECGSQRLSPPAFH